MNPYCVEDLGGVKLEMIMIPLGSFNDERGNIVKITEPFYMGKYPVTQAQWQAVMGNNPSYFKGENLPVEKVTWNDCQEFIQKLSQKTGKQYRLPSEVEWEYCVGEYCVGNDETLFGEYVWYDLNSANKTYPVGQKKPNQFGLHDMNGNVWEWCEDDGHSHYLQPREQKAYKDITSELKIMRGGSWNGYPRSWLSVLRDWINFHDWPEEEDLIIGFRVACSGSQSTELYSP